MTCHEILCTLNMAYFPSSQVTPQSSTPITVPRSKNLSSCLQLPLRIGHPTPNSTCSSLVLLLVYTSVINHVLVHHYISHSVDGDMVLSSSAQPIALQAGWVLIRARKPAP
jgi:hypothetical protein